MTTIITITTQALAQAIWGCDASELTPEDGRDYAHDEKGFYYPDSNASDGRGYPMRMLTGAETIDVVIEHDSKGAKIVGLRQWDSFITDRFGKPGVGLFGAREARSAAAALLAG